MKRNKNKFTIILVVLFVAGLSLLLYPTVSNYINSIHQTRAISTYQENVNALSEEDYTREWENAKEYNRTLLKNPAPGTLSEEAWQTYFSLLNISGDGVMGYIDIPALDVELPIYHGTEDSVLQIAAGHLEWTSLPTGGESTHCVLSGHRGLPSAKLFTDLDKLVVGDVFIISVLDEVLTYEVDQILIVEPQDTQALQIVKGEDYCTLVTCTPYGINTHRLLVRGHRIENAAEAELLHISADAMQIEPFIVASVIGVPLLVLMMLVVLLKDGKASTYFSRLRRKDS